MGGGDVGSSDNRERLMVFMGGWIMKELTTEKRKKKKEVRSIIGKGYKWSCYSGEKDQLAWVKSNVGRREKQTERS